MPCGSRKKPKPIAGAMYLTRKQVITIAGVSLQHGMTHIFPVLPLYNFGARAYRHRKDQVLAVLEGLPVPLENPWMPESIASAIYVGRQQVATIASVSLQHAHTHIFPKLDKRNFGARAIRFRKDQVLALLESMEVRGSQFPPERATPHGPQLSPASLHAGAVWSGAF